MGLKWGSNHSVSLGLKRFSKVWHEALRIFWPVRSVAFLKSSFLTLYVWVFFNVCFSGLDSTMQNWFWMYHPTVPGDRLLAWGADPFVKPRIFPVLINSRSFWREGEGHKPAGRGQGDRESSSEHREALCSFWLLQVPMWWLKFRLYCSNIGVHNSSSLPSMMFS